MDSFPQSREPRLLTAILKCAVFGHPCNLDDERRSPPISLIFRRPAQAFRRFSYTGVGPARSVRPKAGFNAFIPREATYTIATIRDRWCGRGAQAWGVCRTAGARGDDTSDASVQTARGRGLYDLLGGSDGRVYPCDAKVQACVSQGVHRPMGQAKAEQRRGGTVPGVSQGLSSARRDLALVIHKRKGFCTTHF